MDAQTVVNTTMQIIQQITTALTPAAKASYQAAIIGAKTQALSNLLNDSSYLIWIPCLLIIEGISLYLIKFFAIKAMGYKQKGSWDDGNFWLWSGVAFSSVCSLGCFIGLAICIQQNIGSVFFDYQMYQHPDAYLAYQIMQKVTG